MLIRPARAEDFVEIAAITNYYIETTAIHFGYDPCTADDLRQLWEKTRAKHPWLVAEDAQVAPETPGRVIGYAKSGVWRERAAYQWTAEVGLYVAPMERGKGIGTALYDELLSQVALRGFHSAVAGITLPNDASIKLHEKLGFEHVGTFQEAGFKLDAWHSVDFWQKRF
jgi:phosphinothricin acetyltransferase